MAVVPHVDGLRFDPIALVQAVNGLAGADVGDVLAVLRECARLADAGDVPGPPASGVVLVALALFVPVDPGAGLLTPPFGAPDLPLPPPSPELPALPLVFEAQLPFLVVSGYRTGGAPDVSGWLHRCAVAARPRARPLAPECSPIEAVEALTGSAQWARLVPAEHAPRVQAMVRAQALRAAGEAVSDDPMALADDGHWQSVAERLRARSLRWDPERDRFVPTAS